MIQQFTNLEIYFMTDLNHYVSRTSVCMSIFELAYVKLFPKEVKAFGALGNPEYFQFNKYFLYESLPKSLFNTTNIVVNKFLFV